MGEGTLKVGGESELASPDVVARARKLMDRLPPRPWALWRGHAEVFSLVQEQSAWAITCHKGGGRIADFGDSINLHKTERMRIARYFAASPALIEDLCAEIERLRAKVRP